MLCLSKYRRKEREKRLQNTYCTQYADGTQEGIQILGSIGSNSIICLMWIWSACDNQRAHKTAECVLDLSRLFFDASISSGNWRDWTAWWDGGLQKKLQPFPWAFFAWHLLNGRTCVREIFVKLYRHLWYNYKQIFNKARHGVRQDKEIRCLTDYSAEGEKYKIRKLALTDFYWLNL